MAMEMTIKPFAVPATVNNILKVFSISEFPIILTSLICCSVSYRLLQPVLSYNYVGKNCSIMHGFFHSFKVHRHSTKVNSN